MCRKRRQGGIAAGIAATVLLASTQLCAFEAQAASAVNFYIESQPLVKALNQWAIQAGLQVVWPAGNTEAYSSSTPVQGTLEPIEALSLLLEGTGLTFSVVSEGRTVAIRDRERSVRLRGTANSAEVNAGGPRFLRIAAGEVMSQGSRSSGERESGTQGQATAESEDAGSLLEVVVTGTHIGGTRDSASPLQVYTREEINRSAAGNLATFIKRLPQNFGNISDDTAGGTSGGAGATNETGGTGVNLRGLGTDSTLVLINGRRMAASDVDGSFTDVSLIPLSAIERVEVLSDGASAIYGSDAVGGVVNFILRRQFDGPETSVRYGAVSSGDSRELQASQTAGLNWDGGSAMASYEFSDRTALKSSDRGPPVAGPFPSNFDLLPQNRRQGALVTIHHEAVPGLEVFSDTTWGKRQLDRDLVEFDELLNELAEVRVVSTSLGVRKQIGRTARAELAAGYSAGRQDFAQINRSAESTVIARDTDTSVLSVDASVSGSLFEMPAGPLGFAVGTQYRDEDFDRENTLTGLTSYENSRNVTAGFVELKIPLIASPRGEREGNRLEVVLADRYERYSDFGATNNPKIGSIWRPVGGIAFRGTYGTSFKAPLLENLDPRPVQIFALGLPDALAECGVCGLTDTVLITGNNGELKPEKATSWTAGLDFKPETLPGFNLAMTYYHLRYKDRIVGPIEAVGFYDALLSEDILGASVIRRNPDTSTLDSLTSDAIFQDIRALTGSSGLGIAAIADYRLRNLSQVQTSGIDFVISQFTRLSVGSLETGLEATHILELDRKFSPTSSAVDSVSTPYSPVDLKVRVHAAFSAGNSSVAAYLNYVDSYEDNREGAEVTSIDSWTTLDLAFTYKVSQGGGPFDGISAMLSITNVADEDPPIVANPLAPLNFDGTNANALGRFIAFQLSKSW